MNNLDTSLRLMCIVGHPDAESFCDSVTLAWYAGEGAEITVLDVTDREQIWTTRRLRRGEVAALDYGHTCCSRRAHAVSKLYHRANGGMVTTRITTGGETRQDSYYRVFSAVNGGRAVETDLFEGLREPARQHAVAA